MGKKQQMVSRDSACPLTDRPHSLKPVVDSDLVQCEACQDVFPRLGETGECLPDAQNRPESEDRPSPAPEVLGQVRVDPEANVAQVEITFEGLRKLATDVIGEFAKTNLGTDLPHMVAFTMVGVAYLKHMGMGHNQIMEVVSMAWNGDQTGVFALGFDPPASDQSESGVVPE